MMTRILLLSTLLFPVVIAAGQAQYQPHTTREYAYSLIKYLGDYDDIEDSVRIDVLLTIAEYYLQDHEGNQIQLDSAAFYIRAAQNTNVKLKSRSMEGLIMVYESRYARKSGDIETAIQKAKKMIGQMKGLGDNYSLMLGYLELCRCYDSRLPQQKAGIQDAFKLLFQCVPVSLTPEKMQSYRLQLHNFYYLDINVESAEIKEDFLNHLVQIYKTWKDRANELWTRKELADVHYKQGKLSQAINELLQLAKEQKDGGYPGLCYTYDLLAGLYDAARNYEKGLYYALESTKTVRTGTDSVGLIAFYYRVALNYNLTGSKAEALEWSLKGLNYQIATNNLGNVYALITDITANLIQQGRQREALNLVLSNNRKIAPQGNTEKTYRLVSLASCYSAVDNNVMAERYSEELIKLVELRIKQKETTDEPVANRFLAPFFLKIGKYDKAEFFYKRWIADHPETIASGGAKEFLFKLDSAKGNYLSAIKHLQAYQQDKDSIFTVAKSKQIEELKVTYATEQKDSLIKLNGQNIQLLTKQDQLQKDQLRQSTMLRNIGFAVACMLIIIVALLFNRYRLKQRTNKKLELQQQEISHQNHSLQHLLHEKEWLLKEIHHRVKNNLQIVMSLLNSQSAYIDNEPALTAIHDSQHRVHAMSLIHQKLYNSENVSSIDMTTYIRELVAYLSDSFNTGQRIRFELAIEPLELDVSQAVPLGLILNEAITNSIKYAFPDGRNGEISILLSNTAPHHYLLSISDNGVGMPVHVTNNKPGSLGMSLMAGLSEDLDGTFSIENNNGTVIKISFVRDVTVKRPDKSVVSFTSDN
jgi:two-component system, sensor histidine kinase PdtaS